VAEVKAKPAFKKRKITDGVAYKLAQSISDKAFEHLHDNMRERLHAMTEKLYLAMFEATSRTALEEQMRTWPSVLLIKSDAVSIEIDDAGDPDRNSVHWTMHFDQPRSIPRHQYGHLPVKARTSLYDAVQALGRERDNMHGKKELMRRTLQEQLMALGDTHTVAAYWPDVEPLLVEMYGEKLPDRSDVVTPLSALLGKFLPALPAPEAA
jgi:siroheme synthase (precorrin-2 oxidase/ferrochelatase)